MTFVSEEDAIKAKEEATGQLLKERELFIDFARPKPEEETQEETSSEEE